MFTNHKKMSHEFSTLFGTLVFEIYYSVNFGTIFGPYLAFNSFYCANFGILLNHSIIGLEQRHFFALFWTLALPILKDFFGSWFWRFSTKSILVLFGIQVLHYHVYFEFDTFLDRSIRYLLWSQFGHFFWTLVFKICSTTITFLLPSLEIFFLYRILMEEDDAIFIAVEQSAK